MVLLLTPPLPAPALPALMPGSAAASLLIPFSLCCSPLMPVSPALVAPGDCDSHVTLGEQAALIGFKDLVDPDGLVLTNWDLRTDKCAFVGVSCQNSPDDTVLDLNVSAM